jgi:hypothetical protein
MQENESLPGVDAVAKGGGSPLPKGIFIVWRVPGRHRLPISHLMNRSSLHAAALLTSKITNLAEHMKGHRKDFNTRR